MDSLVTQIGVGGIFAVLVIRMVLEWVAKIMDKRKDADMSVNGKSSGSNTVMMRVDDLMRHQRLEHTLEKLAENIAAQTRVLERLDTRVSDVHDKVVNK